MYKNLKNHSLTNVNLFVDPVMRMLPPGQDFNVGTIILENKRHIETERYIQLSDDIRSYNYEGGASKATSLNTLASGEI